MDSLKDKIALTRPLAGFARVVLYLASSASSYVTGSALVVDGGGLA